MLAMKAGLFVETTSYLQICENQNWIGGMNALTCFADQQKAGMETAIQIGRSEIECGIPSAK
jgi:hypothetical protein